MSEYDLQREDWDTVMELSTFSPGVNPATTLSTKTKTAFTKLVLGIYFGCYSYNLHLVAMVTTYIWLL